MARFANQPMKQHLSETDTDSSSSDSASPRAPIARPRALQLLAAPASARPYLRAFATFKNAHGLATPAPPTRDLVLYSEALTKTVVATRDPRAAIFATLSAEFKEVALSTQFARDECPHVRLERLVTLRHLLVDRRERPPGSLRQRVNLLLRMPHEFGFAAVDECAACLFALAAACEELIARTADLSASYESSSEC